MLLHLLLRPLPLLLPIATGWWLAGTLGPWQALAAGAAIAAVLVGCGVLLLRSVRLGEMSWRNRLAGILLPWGYRFGGQLPTIAGISWLVWSLLAGATALATAAAASAPVGAAADPAASAAPYLLLFGWIANGGLLLYTLGHRSSAKSLRRLQALFAATLVGSVALYATGHTVLAAMLAGGPPLVLGLMYGGFLGFVLLVGKNARWN